MEGIVLQLLFPFSHDVDSLSSSTFPNPDFYSKVTCRIEQKKLNTVFWLHHSVCVYSDRSRQEERDLRKTCTLANLLLFQHWNLCWPTSFGHTRLWILQRTLSLSQHPQPKSKTLICFRCSHWPPYHIDKNFIADGLGSLWAILSTIHLFSLACQI